MFVLDQLLTKMTKYNCTTTQYIVFSHVYLSTNPHCSRHPITLPSGLSPGQKAQLTYYNMKDLLTIVLWCQRHQRHLSTSPPPHYISFHQYKLVTRLFTMISFTILSLMLPFFYVAGSGSCAIDAAILRLLILSPYYELSS